MNSIVTHFGVKKLIKDFLSAPHKFELIGDEKNMRHKGFGSNEKGENRKRSAKQRTKWRKWRIVEN